MALLAVVILDGFAPCKGIQIPESGKILLMESGIQLKEYGIPLKIVIQNPSSTDKYWNPYLESGIHSVESRIQDCPGFPYIGKWFLAI